MKFTLTIELGNVGMLSRNDVAIKLKEVADDLVRAHKNGAASSIRDVNGNLVGK